MNTKVIIIIKPKSIGSVDLHNVLNSAKGDQPLPSEVEQISEGVFLMDIRKSLAFFSALVYSAQSRGLTYSVFVVEDEFHVPANT